MNNISEKPCIQDNYRTFSSLHDRSLKCKGSGERELWCAILNLAVKNATTKYNSRTRTKARDFINDDDGMFPIICNILSINPDAARERLIAKYRRK